MITEQQRQERRKYLGSSDISALFVDDEGLSLNPFATALDVWTQKVYELEPEQESDAMEKGTRYESAIIEFAEKKLGTKVENDPDMLNFVDNIHLADNGKPIFACNLDGFIHNGDVIEIVEAKTTGLSSEWGEPGTDDVPMRVILQVNHQMLCTGYKKAHIAVLLGKWGLKEEMYVVERNEDIINAIVKAGLKFWNDNVLKKIPPEQTEAGKPDLFKRIIRVPNKFAEIDPAIMLEWETRRNARLDAEKAEKEQWAEVLKYLGDAEGANLPDGRMFTYFQQKGAYSIDRDTLKTKYPEIWKEVSKETYHRVARIKKG